MRLVYGMNSLASPRRLLLLMLLLCLGTVIQMLGVPMSLWDLEGTSDPVASSLLEGFAIISDPINMNPLSMSQRVSDSRPPAYRVSPQYLFFHPPPLIG